MMRRSTLSLLLSLLLVMALLLSACVGPAEPDPTPSAPGTGDGQTVLDDPNKTDPVYDCSAVKV